MNVRHFWCFCLLSLVLPALPMSAQTVTGDSPRPTSRGTNTLAVLEETWQRRKLTLGADHTNTLAALRSLASAYTSLGRVTNALPLYEENLKLTRAKLGAEHPETLTSMHMLAQSMANAGRFAEAQALFEQTLKLRQTKLGADSPATLTTMEGLTRVHLALNQHAKAEALSRTLLTTARQLRGATNRILGDASLLLGESLLRQGKFVEAEVPLREGVPILEKAQQGLSPAFSAQSLLGWSLLGQKKFAEAEPLLVTSYEGLQRRDARRPDPSHAPVLKEAGERVVKLYEAWGKPERAAEWRKKLAGTSTTPARSSP